MSNSGKGDSAKVALAYIESLTARFGIPAHAFYSKSKILSVRYNFDQNWSAMLQIMRTEGSNTELASEERRAVTDRVGLRVSYSW